MRENGQDFFFFLTTETCNNENLIKIRFLLSEKCLTYVNVRETSCVCDICALCLIVQSPRHKIKSPNSVDVTMSTTNAFHSWSQKNFSSLKHLRTLKKIFVIMRLFGIWVFLAGSLCICLSV